MGIVKRQGIFNSIIIYAGMGMGYVNTVILFPRAIGIENYGLFNLVIGIALLFTQLPASGIVSVLSRYFPYFRTEDKSHKGILELIIVVGTAVFSLSTLLYFIFRRPILDFYSHQSDIIHGYDLHMLPLAFCILALGILDILSRAIYKTVFIAFLKEFFLKFGTSAALLLVLLGHLDFDGFFRLYVILYALVCLLAAVQVAASGEFKLKWKIEISAGQRRQLLGYGFYGLLVGTPWILIQKIDQSILAYYTQPAVWGGYALYINMALAITVPRNAMNRITYQVVADAWKDRDLQRIGQVYAKTSILQLLSGLLLFIGIIVNRDNLFELMRNQDYSAFFPFFYFLGLAQLADVTGGLNSFIIATSARYRMGAWLVLASCLFCILANVLLIPVWGGMGAACSYFLTLVLYNMSTWWYLKKHYSMQPFGWKHLLGVVFAGIAFLPGWLLPALGNVWIDILVRSALVTVVYGTLVAAFRLSEDVNQTLVQLAEKARAFTRGRK